MDIIGSLKALGDDSRLRIVHLLSKGSFNVQELTGALDLSQSTISHHVKILERAGLLEVRKEGSWSFYSLLNVTNSNENNSFEGELLQLTLSAITRTEKLLDQLEKDRTAIDKVLNARRDKAKAYFDTVARDWSALRDEAQGKADYLSVLKERIPSTGALLELGCGSGALLSQLAPREGETIGVDYSDAMIREAREALNGSGENVDLRLGYLEHLPVGDETIDLAVACMVFHHLAEPTEVLRDVHRVLKPGAKLIVVDLTEHDNELMRERYADLWLGFDPKDFTNWVTECGFKKPCSEVLSPEDDVFILETFKN